MTEIHERDTAAEHATRLQEVTAGLAAAATTAEIADVIISQGIPALSARTGILGVLERPDELRFVASVGYGDVFPGAAEARRAVADRRRRAEPRDHRAPRPPRAACRLRGARGVWEASGHGTLVAVPLDRP